MGFVLLPVVFALLHIDLNHSFSYRYFEEKKENKIIKNCDSHLATIHYLKLIESDLVELFLLGIKDVPSKAEIENSVQSGVEIFLAAYLV